MDTSIAVSARRTRARSHARRDRQLVERAMSDRADAAESLEQLLACHRPWVVRRCRSWLGSWSDAEDVAQETLMRVCAGLHGLEQRTRFKPWLARIVDNQCKTFLARRSRWITVEHIESLIDLLEYGEASGEASPESELATLELVHRIMDGIPPQARQVLHLRFFEDQSLEEIARTLEVSLSAAKMRLYRALERVGARFETHAA
jgi:RNA polymerase sigma-70 factor (ECF subfamily)